MNVAASDGSFEFERIGVRVSPELGSGAGTATADEGSVFLDNARIDSDLVIKGTPRGLETFSILRSEDSPEVQRFEFSLPAGARLVLRGIPEGSGGAPTQARQFVEVVDRDERPLMSVAPPLAHDADGEPVLVTYEVEGRTLAIRAEHRGKDLAYPIQIDPLWDVQERFMTWRDNGNWVDNAGWQHKVAGGCRWSSTFGNPWWHSYYWGLYTWSDASQWCDDGWSGEWVWVAPRNSRIFRADMAYIRHWWNYSCIELGIWSVRNWRWDAPWEANGNAWRNCNGPPNEVAYQWPTLCGGYYCENWRGSQGNALVFKLRLLWTGWREASPIGYLGGASIYLQDDESPWIDNLRESPGAPTGWVKSGVYEQSPSAHDDGLGMMRYDWIVPGQPTQTRVHPCQGSARCPWEWGIPDPNLAHLGFNTPFRYDVSKMPEGIQRVTLRAYDTLEKTADANRDIKVDRTPPKLTLSGEVHEPADGILDGDDRTLHVDARDGSTTSPADQRSGVQQVSVQVDNDPPTVYTNANPCDSCPIVEDWQFPYEEYAEGEHRITVRARDHMGHESEPQTWVVNVDPSTPALSLAGSLSDAEGEIISEPEYELDIGAFDGEDADPSSGAESIRVEVDDVPKLTTSTTCTSGSCRLYDTFTFETAEYTEGQHTIEVTTTDRAGNETTESFIVYVEHLPSLPSQTLSLDSDPVLRIDGAAAGDNAGHSVARIGDLNVDGIDDYAIGAPRASNNLRTHAGAVYVVYGSASTDPVDLANLGSRGFRIDGAQIGDLAGTAVAPAGDVNGDAVPDLLIGAPGGESLVSAGPTQGRVYVVFGAASSPDVDLATLGTRGYAINGPAIGASTGLDEPGRFGASLAGGRSGVYGVSSDVNGDGRDDVVIGASDASNNLRPRSGSAYVVFGKIDNLPVSVDSLGNGGFRIDGAATGHAAGRATSVVGDVNEDDRADVVVTAPGESLAGRTDAGTAYVLFGKADAANIDLAALGSAGFPIHGRSGDRLGSSVASLGDLDPDGLADFALGGRGAWVIYPTKPLGPVDLAGSYDGYHAAPPAGSEYDTSVVSDAGDLNDDDTPDLLVSFPGAAGNGTAAGETYAVLSQLGRGAPESQVDLVGMPGERGSRLTGATANERAGTGAVGTDPSADTDVASIVVGAPGASANARDASGSVYVMSSQRLAYNETDTGTTSTGGASGSELSAAQSSPEIGPARLRKGCWRKQSAWTNPEDIYECRVTARGNLDRTLRSPRRGYEGDRYDLGDRGRKKNFGNARRHPTTRALQPNPDQGGLPRWPILDSFGEPIAWIWWRGARRYSVYEAHPTDDNAIGAFITDTPKTGWWILYLTGRGCMSDNVDKPTDPSITTQTTRMPTRSSSSTRTGGRRRRTTRNGTSGTRQPAASSRSCADSSTAAPTRRGRSGSSAGAGLVSATTTSSSTPTPSVATERVSGTWSTTRLTCPGPATGWIRSAAQARPISTARGKSLGTRTTNSRTTRTRRT